MWLTLKDVTRSEYNNKASKERDHRPFSINASPRKNKKVNSMSYDNLPFDKEWHRMLHGLQIAINHFKVYFSTMKRNNWPMVHEHMLSSVVGLRISRYRAYNARLINDKEHRLLYKIYHPCYIITSEEIDAHGFERNRNECKLINSYVVAKAHGKWNLFYKYNHFVTCNALGGSHLAKIVGEEKNFSLEDFYDTAKIIPQLAEVYYKRKCPKAYLVTSETNTECV